MVHNNRRNIEFNSETSYRLYTYTIYSMYTEDYQMKRCTKSTRRSSCVQRGLLQVNSDKNVSQTRIYFSIDLKRITA